MSKLSCLAVTLLIIGSLMLPTVVMAQPSVCGFYGTATIDGASIDAGTVIKAWIDGTKVSETTTTSDIPYNYSIKIAGDYAGKMVTFTVGPDDFNAGSSAWEAGKNARLNLNGTEEALPPVVVLPDPAIELLPEEGLVTQVSGEGFTPGLWVNIRVGGVTAISMMAEADGTFNTVIAAPTQNAGTYTVTAAGGEGGTADAVFTVPDLSGDPGPAGEPGIDGPEGPKGASGGTGMALASLILAIIAIIFSGIVALRIISRRR